MSIASEITRLQTAKANIKTSIENKGVVVSSADKLDDYSSLIDSINISTQEKVVNPQNYTREIIPDVGYRGLSKVVLDGVLVDAHDSYTSITDSDVSYTKSVPSGALKYASIDKAGGMSYKTTNLIPITTGTKSSSSITFTFVNGVCNSSGTPSNTGWIRVITITLNAGTYYFKDFTSGETKFNLVNNNYQQLTYPLTLTETTTIYLAVTGTSLNTAQLVNSMPMLVSGSTAPTEFQPYFEGIRDSAVTSVKSYGMNVWDEQWEVGGYSFVNGNGANFNNRIRSKSTNYISVIPNATYYVHCGDTNAKWCPFFYDKNYNYVGSLNNSYVDQSYYINTTFTTPPNAHYLRFYITSVYGTTYNNDICINLSSSGNGTYKAYRGLIETKTIPAEVQALEGWGRGINTSCYNVLDMDTGDFTDKDSIVDMGTLIYYKLESSSSWLFEGSVSNKANGKNLLCDLYTTYYESTSAWNIAEKSIVGAGTSNKFYIKDTSYTTASDFKTAMDGVNLQYEKDTYSTTNVSAYLPDRYIEVEEGGYLVFENTYEQAVPSEITYLVEV